MKSKTAVITLLASGIVLAGALLLLRLTPQTAGIGFAPVPAATGIASGGFRRQ